MDETKLPFTEHLRELRIRLRNAVLALLAGWALAYAFSQTLFAFLTRPLVALWAQAGYPVADRELGYASLIEPFWTYFELSLWAGMFLASPVIFYQLWKFIAPGLYKKEKRLALPFALFSALFFVSGALFCFHFVLPAAFKFFLSYSTSSLGDMRSALGFDVNAAGGTIAIAPNLFMRQYLDLVLKFLLGFGIIFELPLLIFFLSWIGMVTHRSLWRFNKYAAVIAFILGAILTPGPDVVSQLMMATPMMVLYNLSIVAAFIVTRGREKKDAEERAKEAEADRAAAQSSGEGTIRKNV